MQGYILTLSQTRQVHDMDDNATNLILRFLEDLDLTAALFTREALDKRIGVLKDEAKISLRNRIVEEAAALGISSDDLLGQPAARRTTVPKYRNPHNQAETWTGRGKPPAWFSENIDSGIQKESMLIPTNSEIPFP